MKTPLVPFFQLTFSSLLLSVCLSNAQTAAFTYQGNLNDGQSAAHGSYDLTFALFDAASGGAQQSGTWTQLATSVSNGLFTVTLDFGNQFPGANRWLEIGVRTNGGGAFVTLNRRQPITATPYALRAITAGSAATVAGVQLNTNLSSTALGFNTQADGSASTAMGNSSVAAGGAATAMGQSTLASGAASLAAGQESVASGDNSTAFGFQTIASGAQATSLGQSTTAGGFNSFAAGTQSRAHHDGSFVWADYNFVDFTSTATNQFLIRAAGGVGINTNNPNGAALAVNGNVSVNGTIGTMGNQALEFNANGKRAMRLEPTTSTDTVNVIGGSARNFVDAGVVGATIGGGGSGNFFGGRRTNRVGANFGTVSGGYENTIRSGSDFATIGGGYRNAIYTGAANTTIGGGSDNTILVNTAGGTIGGGSQNTILIGTGSATIGGGRQNTILSGGHSGTIPGGEDNSATNYAFAAGRRAKANHTGAFVWADSMNADFASTGMNQFLIRASGGVGVGTPNPQGTLHVYSDNNPTVVRVQSTGTPGAARLEFVSNPQGDVNEWRPGFIESTDSGGFTGGLTFNVNGTGAGNKFGNLEVMRVVNGRVGIGTATPSSALQVVGTVTATAFNPPSDRNLKENFAPVNPRDVLEKVASLPISRWNFKGDEATPHVGPMAQDFHAAFRLGTDERHIATVDADGVALAAIQGLNQKLEAEGKAKDARISELEERLSAIESLLKK